MTNKTKMIIITSDEDIIRQFSFKNNQNTHIIDIDNNQQITSISKDNNNIINLEFLTQLSGANSNNDQVFKRALESSDHGQSKPVKVSKKSSDIICTVCGDYAIGYNYDALSCASCKAFFRRNANQNSEKIRCITGRNQCSVAHGTPRKCAKCRLNRCFTVGMRKDFILSEEEKQRRKKRLEENRTMTSQRILTTESENLLSISQPTPNTESLSPIFHEIDQLLMDANEVDGSVEIHDNINLNSIEHTSSEFLSIDQDSLVIEKLRLIFLSFAENFHSPRPWDNASDRTSAIISWSEVASEAIVRFINFFRQIDEFENLHADDRFTLIKYNLFAIFPIYKCYNYDPTDPRLLNGQDGETTTTTPKFFMLDDHGIRKSFISLIVSLSEVTEQDPIVIPLLLLILLFSQGLSMCEGEPLLNDPLAVNRAQSYYTKILWNYLINKQGETKTYKQFTELLTKLFRIQCVAKELREVLLAKFTTSNTLNKIAPLIQTVLHVS